MSKRITNSDLKLKEEVINAKLDKIQIRVAHRYNYTAIDLYDKQTGEYMFPLIAGLTKRQAYEILEAINTILQHEIGIKVIEK